MSTTIDSLIIEIQTSSSNAAGGIDRLAASLERLKKVGSFNVVIKNLNNLSTALNGLQTSSSGLAKLNALASSIDTLKKAGSLGSISNSFAKLGPALKELEKINVDGIVSKIKELNDKLGPVSKNVIAVGNAVRNLNTNTKGAGTSFGHLGSKVNVTSLNMSNMINVIRGLISALRPIITMLGKVIGEAIEWDGIAQRFGRGFGDQAEETYAWIQRLNKEMGINTQQFMQYSSTYATMLKGFGVASKDASEMALGYMELTYDVWAGYNDIYKSLDDAATAIRSAIAGEVEPVRKAGFTIIESTLEQTASQKWQEVLASTSNSKILAQTAANHNLKISLENATEAQKSYLRYLTLTDQAYAQGLVGSYAREMNTAEGVMRTFNQQLKSLGQTFGSLFLPILVKVMPWLQAFVSLLTDAVMTVAGLFGVDIQKVDFSGFSNSAASATSAVEGTTKAVKELKNATTGIDELNVISPQSGGGSSGSSSSIQSLIDGVDINSLWDESVFDSIQSEVDEIKQKFKDWLGITDDINSWADIFKTKLGNILVVVGLIASVLVIWKIITTIVNVIDVIGKLKSIGGGNTATPDATGGGGGFSNTTAKLKTLVADLALGLVVILEVAAAAALVVGAIWLLGVELEQVGIAWGPVIENGETVAIAMGIGTAILVGVGFAAYGLGTLGKTVALNIGIGIAILAELGIAAGLFIAEIWGIGVLLDKVGKAWSPVLDNGEDIAIAIGVGTGLLVGIGVVAAALGVATVASAGLLPVAIGLGTALLVELAVAFVAFTESLIEVADQLRDELHPALEGTSEILPGLNDNMSEFTSFMSDFAGKTVSYTKSSAIAGIAASVDKFISFFTTDPIKNMASEVLSQKAKMDTLVSNLKKTLPVLKDANSLLGQFNTDMGNLKAKMGANGKSSGTIGYVISIGVSLVKQGWSSIKNWLGNLNFDLGFKLPKIRVKWGEKTVAGFKISFPNGFETYAKGGFPDIGEMFIAREAGPEMVGKIGNRTTVANNDQIVEGISEGVYSAVVAAMRAVGGNNGNAQSVNVYLDGREITASVERRQHERGASLMGNQVYSY